uniref:Ovule protein n=1 Tax=Mesocestoides corti TaxID=53468 RepID=A0A5K3FBF6_MESCO
ERFCIDTYWAATVENQSSNRKETGTTEQISLTNHKPEPHIRRLPSESTTLATLFIISCTSFTTLLCNFVYTLKPIPGILKPRITPSAYH